MTEVEATVPAWRQAVVLPGWQPITVTNQTVLTACKRELGLIIEAAGLRSSKAGRFMTSVCQRGAKRCWKKLATPPERNDSSANQPQQSTQSVVTQEPYMRHRTMVTKGQRLLWLPFASVIPMNCNSSE